MGKYLGQVYRSLPLLKSWMASRNASKSALRSASFQGEDSSMSSRLAIKRKSAWIKN